MLELMINFQSLIHCPGYCARQIVRLLSFGGYPPLHICKFVKKKGEINFIYMENYILYIWRNKELELELVLRKHKLGICEF